MLPLVAFVGRPNVGKSTLFNKVVGKRLAIVEDRPGVTRDRHYAEAEHAGRRFRVVDTGGFLPKSEEKLIRAVREQAEEAIREADVLVLVVDARAGLTSADRELAQVLRRSGKPLLLAANKMDSVRSESESDTGELHALGLDQFPVSAEHGRGVHELLDAVLEHLPPSTEPVLPDAQEDDRAGASAGGEGEGEGDEAELAEEVQKPKGPIRLAVIGRPNVGKSTLLNRIIGKERFVASALPGTTRDAVDETLEYGGRTIILTDTAGLRKKRQVIDKVEIFSAQRALRAVDESDVVIILTDATDAGVDQDARIAAQAEERGRAVILAVNKWDLVKDKEGEGKKLRDQVERHLQHVGYAPLVFISALQGTRVQKVLDLALELHDEAAVRLPTPALNDWIQRMQDEHPAPLWNGFPVRFFYAYQTAIQPVTILVQCNRPAAVDDSYRRFLVHGLRDQFKLRVPVRLLFRAKSGSTPRGIRKPRE